MERKRECKKKDEASQSPGTVKVGFTEGCSLIFAPRGNFAAFRCFLPPLQRQDKRRGVSKRFGGGDCRDASESFSRALDC